MVRTLTPPKKKVQLTKRYCIFCTESFKEDMSWLSKLDYFTGNCTLCRQSFPVKYDGKFAVSSQAKSQKKYNLAERKHDIVCVFC